MLITKQFDRGELIFEIIKPYIPDAKSGELLESDKWMVLIHKGTVSWFAGGPLLDTKTEKTALFPSSKDALNAAVEFAHHCGLQDA